jgi:autotransporter strand-loop-strand O-heptosyltransferase
MSRYKIINVTPGLLPIPPNGWGAVEKIIWEYHQNFLSKGYESEIVYLNDIRYTKNTIVHLHVANLALIAHERGIPYYFTCHDHHAYLYGKESLCFQQNYDAIKHSIKSFVPAKYLVDYFDLPNLEYLSHGVNADVFKHVNRNIDEYKLLCVANNGFIHDPSEDRKGFTFAINAAKKLNLPITIAGPENNKKFFERYNFNYEKLNVIYNLSETDLVKLYQSHDIFLHPSILEAGHPNLTLLEAISCGLPIVGTFEDNNNLDGLLKVTRNVDEIVDGIKHVIKNYDEYKKLTVQSTSKKSWSNIVDQLINFYSSDMKNQLIEIYKNTNINHRDSKEPQNRIIFDFNEKAKVEILGTTPKKYNIKFIDKNNNKIIYQSNVHQNMWSQSSVKYFIDWNIQIYDQDTNSIIREINLDLSDKNVMIVNESPSMGDLVAWVAYVDLFQKKHKCILDFYTPYKDLFESEYPNINFYDYNRKKNTEYYASYRIGCFDPSNDEMSPKDYRTQNLQEIAANILGFNDYQEVRTKIYVKDKERKIQEKYVCISTASTAGCKHWQNVDGWQKVVDYLNEKGYKVVVIQKESLNYMDLKGLKNVIHPQTKSIHEAISWIYNCDFFIGLSSGNSWLAWALDKKVVMISGFTKKFNEFFSPYRVINENVCNGCWNDKNHKFDKGDWNWCPVNKNTDKQFECSKQITFEMVKEKIDKILNNDTCHMYPKFDEFAYKEIFEWNQYEKFVTVDKNDTVLDLGCSKGYFYFKHKDKNINYIGIDGSTDCLNDFIYNLGNDTSPKLLHSLIDSNRSVHTFASMFHNNSLQKSLSITFGDVINIINRKIDFLKFDIEGYEKCIFDENYDLFKSSVFKFSGEFHFLGEKLSRKNAYEIIKKMQLDSDINIKLFSIDGVDITESFWSNPDFYTEIIVSGYVDKNQKL